MLGGDRRLLLVFGFGLGWCRVMVKRYSSLCCGVLVISQLRASLNVS
jgi:hypothetical protein